MPISWDLIAALFRTPLRMQTLDITRGLERLERWLEARVKGAEALELSSRGYPIIGFYNGALTVHVDEVQRGALHRPPERGVGATLAASGQAFASGLGRVGQAVTEEGLLPGLIERLVNVVDLIATSMDRSIPARPGMFDVSARTGSDLFGQVGLLFHTVTRSTGGLLALAGDLGEARNLLGPASSAAAATPEGPAASLPELLDQGSRWILGGILILPILPTWVGQLARAGNVFLRNLLLQTFQGVETRIFGLRRQIFDVFSRELPELIVSSLRMVVGVWSVVELHWRFYVQVAAAYGADLISHVTTFLSGLQAFLNYWIGVVNGISAAIEGVLDTDLAPYIAVVVLGPLGLALGGLGALPTFTVRDAIGLGASAARNAFRLWLTLQIGTAELALRGAGLATRAFRYLGGPLGWWLGPKATRGVDAARFRVGAARRLVWRLFAGAQDLPAETAVPFTLPASFPNVFDAFFGPGAPDLRATLTGARSSLEEGVRGILGGGVALLTDLSTTFERSTASAATMGSPARWRRIATGATSLADIALGDQIGELESRVRERREDPVAAAFEGWLTRGGFHVVGAAIPLYVEEMDRFWREQSAEGHELTEPLTATSPHKLVRRAALGRVRVPGITVTAPARPPGADLANEVATQLKTAIEQSYVTGRERLAGLAAAAH
ncbi:hypothetical protein ACIHQR_10575 [Corallococcus coralloides]|uniref:hypothetical protein n=1 Tax=Corallococcus coralloides TaxID=184914 RepID=UPI00384CC275